MSFTDQVRRSYTVFNISLTPNETHKPSTENIPSITLPSRKKITQIISPKSRQKFADLQPDYKAVKYTYILSLSDIMMAHWTGPSTTMYPSDFSSQDV